MEFSWDTTKARVNAAKHGVTFTEAATVFDDDLAWTFLIQTTPYSRTGS
jgi:uncharacterized DUF497 family protein